LPRDTYRTLTVASVVVNATPPITSKRPCVWSHAVVNALCSNPRPCAEFSKETCARPCGPNINVCAGAVIIPLPFTPVSFGRQHSAVGRANADLGNLAGYSLALIGSFKLSTGACLSAHAHIAASRCPLKFCELLFLDHLPIVQSAVLLSPPCGVVGQVIESIAYRYQPSVAIVRQARYLALIRTPQWARSPIICSRHRTPASF
jgi:hypothetical protein